MCVEVEGKVLLGPVDWKDLGIKLVFGVQDFLRTTGEKGKRKLGTLLTPPPLRWCLRVFWTRGRKVLEQKSILSISFVAYHS